MRQLKRPQLPLRLLRGLSAIFPLSSCPETDTDWILRVKKRKKVEPTPRNAFPHVVEKVRGMSRYHPRLFDSCPQGLVSDTEARELYHM